MKPSPIRGISYIIQNGELSLFNSKTRALIATGNAASGELTPSTPHYEAAAAPWRDERGEPIRLEQSNQTAPTAPPPPPPQPVPEYGPAEIDGVPVGTVQPRPDRSVPTAHVPTDLADGSFVRLDGLTVGKVRDGVVWVPSSGSEAINRARALIREGVLVRLSPEGDL